MSSADLRLRLPTDGGARSLPRTLHLVDAAALFLVTTLVASGIWLDLDRPKLGVLVGAVFLALTLARRWTGESFVLGLPPRKGVLRALAVALLAIAPVAVYLALTWREEFPFLGDHDFHLGTSWAALDFWSKWAPWVATGFALMAAAALLGRPRFWPLAAFAVLLGSSFFFATPSLFARYPSLGYFVDAPFNRLFRWLDSPSPLNALRLATASSVVVWLLVLRPLFLKRWPAAELLPFALYFLYQRDVFYFFTTSYFEPWAIVFALVTAEYTLRECRPAGIALLLVGAAAMFKEQAILLLPFTWLAQQLQLQGLRQRLESTFFAVVAATPFVAYVIFRNASGVWRNFKFAGLRVFDAAHFAEFGHRLLSQFDGSGLLLFPVALVALWPLTRPARRTALIFLAAALAQALFFFVDELTASRWTGYPRFHLLAVALFGSPLLVSGSRLLESGRRRRFALACLLILAIQAPTAIAAFSLTAKPDPARNFLEHYDSPVFLPIRQLVREAEARGFFTATNQISVYNPFRDYFFDGMPGFYPDLGRRFRFLFRQQSCRCTRDRAVLILFIYPAGLDEEKSRDPRFAIDKSWEPACVEEVYRSCGKVWPARMPDGSLVGLIGSAPP